jgi:hypothetical protein
MMEGGTGEARTRINAIGMVKRNVPPVRCLAEGVSQLFIVKHNSTRHNTDDDYPYRT